MSFQDELVALINIHSQENESDTPDYVLASFLGGVLDQFNAAVRARTAHSNTEVPPDEEKEYVKPGFHVTLGKLGLHKSWQGEFPDATECVHCGADSRIGFTAFESGDGSRNGAVEFVYDLHKNEPNGDGMWPHDRVAVAVYYCRKCLKATALHNQA